MNTLPIDLYKVIEYGLGGDTWQEFIDRYKDCLLYTSPSPRDTR